MPVASTTTRITLNNILFTTDFSAASTAALPFARALANWCDAKIFVAHVVPAEPLLSVPFEAMPQEADPLWRNAEQDLKTWVNDAALGTIPCETLLHRGDLRTVVTDMIRKNDIDLLVLGTHGRQGLKRLILGSEAELIYREARCPVLTVGPGVAAYSRADWKIRTILFPTDFSDISLQALPYALSLAEENEATLALFHSIPLVPWQYEHSLAESHRQRLQALVPKDAEAWCKPEFVVRFDSPVDATLHLAEGRKADLIVMGVRHPAAAAVSAHLPGVVASEIVSLAPCPVLTVRG